VKLGGIGSELKVGDGIEVSYRHKRARFRVIWIIVRPGSSEKRIGAACCEPGKNLGSGLAHADGPTRRKTLTELTTIALVRGCALTGQRLLSGRQVANTRSLAPFRNSSASGQRSAPVFRRLQQRLLDQGCGPT
jgi:ribosomal protein L28